MKDLKGRDLSLGLSGRFEVLWRVETKARSHKMGGGEISHTAGGNVRVSALQRSSRLSSLL
jgi:hypothetical protein